MTSSTCSLSPLFSYVYCSCTSILCVTAFFYIGTLVSSSNISAQAHFVFHQTIIQSELCLQLSPSWHACRWHDSSGINGSSLLPGPWVERLRPMKERSCDYRWVLETKATRQSDSGKRLPSLKTLPERGGETRWHVFKRVILCFYFHDITLECTFGTVWVISGDNDSFLDPKITENQLFLSSGKQSGWITGAIYKSNITQSSNEGTHSCCWSDLLRGKYQICTI